MNTAAEAASSLRGEFAVNVDKALRRARRRGRAVLAVSTCRMDGPVDPTAAVLLGELGGADWSVLDQPRNNRSSVAGLDGSLVLAPAGPGRFGKAAAEWRALVGEAVFDDPGGPSGTGPLALGGFGFSGADSVTGPWSGFGASSLAVHSVVLRRWGDRSWLTLQAPVHPDDDPSEVVGAVGGAVERLEFDADFKAVEQPLSEAATAVSSALPPAHYEGAVARVIDAIAEGRVAKAVLAREVLVEREVAHDPAWVLATLRENFPECFSYGIGRSGAAFVGASPELLVRREGSRAATVALAGSAPRSADPSVDDHLGERLLRSRKDRDEQEIVAATIKRALEPMSVWVTAADQPEVVRIANIQHLATPIRAQLRSPVGAVDLLAALHPTPAVGGEPWREAEQLIAEVEGLDRGWYAAPVGWTDAAGDGEFCVALRGALLRGTEARCYAGVGVVDGSDPSAELAETELKLQAVLPVVSS